jgi:hypothetical protein
LRPGADVALIKRVQQRVTGAIGHGAGALHRFLAEVRRVAAERTLIERAVVVAVERHPEMLKLVDHFGCALAHEFDCVLIAQPIGALDRVVHVPQPRVLGHVAERCADAALSRDGMRDAWGTLSRARRPTDRLRQAAATPAFQRLLRRR